MQQLWSRALVGALLGLGLLSTVLPMPARACAVCGGSEDNGYFWGVVFLMSMPFVVGSVIGGWLLYSYRRAKAGLTASGPAPTVEQCPSPRPASTSSRLHPGFPLEGERARWGATLWGAGLRLIARSPWK
jgi:hypothetical protein